MNLSINNARNSNPSFGMAVLRHPSFDKAAKDQAMRLSKKGYNKFWEQLDAIKENQKDNPINIILKAKGKKCNSKKLEAVVVDARENSAIKTYAFSQGLFSRNGSLKFLEKAGLEANKINEMNRRLESIETAYDSALKPSNKAEGFSAEA